MTHTDRFGLFTRALEDCLAIAKDAPTPFGRAIHGAAAAELRASRRFYLPEAVNLLEGRRIDADIKSLIRLPFHRVAVLSETTLQGATPERGWKITLACDDKAALPNMLGSLDHGFAVMGLISFPSVIGGRWCAMPGVVGVDLPADRDGYAVHQAKIAGLAGAPTPIESGKLVADFGDDVWCVMNLCIMLGMQNVKDTNEVPPPALNKRRLQRGKQPLLDYRILVVDGERWDAPPKAEMSAGGGVRSHLRRGHIRRLDGGARRIWVRAAYVHGSVPGFVDKDYAISPPSRVL
jgi:hypothetical protein